MMSPVRLLVSPCRTFASKAGESLSNEILNVLEQQKKLLESIDSRLQNMEKHGKGLVAPKANRANKRPVKFVEGTWAFTNPSTGHLKKYGETSAGGITLHGKLFPYGEFPTMRSVWDVEKASMNMLTFNGVSKTMLKSDTYNLKVRYNKGKATKEGTVISIGEIEFKSDGTAGAEGADWDRLLSNQRQTQLPYAHGARGKPKWLEGKVSEPWEDGDALSFIIDTNENTITFQRNNLPKKAQEMADADDAGSTAAAATGKDDEDNDLTSEHEFDDDDESGAESRGSSKRSKSSKASKSSSKKKSKKAKRKAKKKKKRKAREMADLDASDADDGGGGSSDLNGMSREEAREMFVRERDEILSQIPKDAKDRFRECGFATWGKVVYPIIEIGPYDISPGDLRDQWFAMFENVSCRASSVFFCSCFVHAYYYWLLYRCIWFTFESPCPLSCVANKTSYRLVFFRCNHHRTTTAIS